MQFSNLLKAVSGKPPKQSVDVFSMVNGKPSNAAIMDDMLEGGTSSDAVKKHLVESAVTMGFTQDQAEQYWG